MSDPHDSMIPLTALDRPIAFHRIFRTITGKTVAALFLSQAWYWAQRVPEGRDGWFYKTKVQWEEETGLSETEQGTARKTLKQLGVLEDELRGLPAQLWYRVDTETLAKLVQAHTVNKIGVPIASSSEESSDLDTRNHPIIHTETTAETTPETTSVAPKRKKKTETPIEEPFGVDDATYEWARTEGFTAAQVFNEQMKFVDYHAAKGTKFVDWQRAFKNWLRNAKEWGTLDRGSGNGRKVAYYDKNGNFTVEGSLARARGEI